MKKSVKVLLVISLVLNVGFAIYTVYQKAQAERVLVEAEMYKEVAEMNEKKAMECVEAAEKSQALARQAMIRAEEQIAIAEKLMKEKNN